jgi:hypothetical protein
LKENNLMTIGITAIIKPSRVLTFSLLLMVLLTFFSIIWALFCLSRYQYFYFFCILFFLIGLILIRFFWNYWENLKIFQLEISNKGDMVLRYVDRYGYIEKTEAEIVYLQPHTVLWPFFIILLLKTQQNKIINLPIFLDSVEKNTFRSLSVAIRWISVRTNE